MKTYIKWALVLIGLWLLIRFAAKLAQLQCGLCHLQTRLSEIERTAASEQEELRKLHGEGRPTGLVGFAELAPASIPVRD